MALLKLVSVAKKYRSGNGTLTALSDIDLEVDAGSFLCIAGPSGSGKSTLLYLIGLLDFPTAGRIVLDDVVTGRCSRSQAALLRRRLIGFVFQSFNLVPVLTAYENVEYALLLQHGLAAGRRQRVMAALDDVGLAAKASAKVPQLSGGEQQRVAIARAIVTRPALLLADEPTANLDSATGKDIIDLFARINRQYGTTFLFSSHDTRIIQRARRVVTLVDGRIVASTSPLPDPDSPGDRTPQVSP